MKFGTEIMPLELVLKLSTFQFPLVRNTNVTDDQIREVGDEDPITYDPLRMRDNVIVLDEGHIR
jgi:hypothetical protein